MVMGCLAYVSLLPIYATWIVLLMLWAYLTARIANWVGGWIAMRGFVRYTGSQWVERARLASPPRAATAMGVIILGVVFGTAIGGWATVWLEGHNVGMMPYPPMLAAACLGAIHGRVRICARFVQWPVTLGRWLTATFTVMVLFPALPVVTVLAVIMPSTWSGATVAYLVAGGLLLAGPTAWNIRLGRMLCLIRPASPRVARIVAVIAERSQCQPLAVWEMSLLMANAVAFPTQRQIAITSEATASMNDAELAAISAHELGHLQEDRSTHWMRQLASMSWLPLCLIKPVHAYWEMHGVMALLVIVWISSSWFSRFSRKMEYAADAAAQRTQSDPAAYAKALERLHEVNLMPAVHDSRTQTYPHLYDRMLAAGVQPDYPRPLPPPRLPALAGVLVALFAGCASSVLLIALHLWGPLAMIWHRLNSM